MRDNDELIGRAAELKQALLLALKQANQAALDGSRDEQDLQDLAHGLDQIKRARDMLDQLIKRLEFHIALDRLATTPVSDDASRMVIGLVRLGVDGGYDVGEVRRMVDRALRR